MAYFAQLGKPLVNGQAVLTNGAPSATLRTPLADEWTDVYSVVLTTDETAQRTVTISDGTTSVPYLTGGGVANPPVIDAPGIPIRFGKGLAITANAVAITAGKHISVAIRGLSSKT